MSEAKHTPGPWRLPHFVSEDSGCDCGYIFANDDRMGAVASVHFHKRECDDNPPKDEAKANARLIAAAPDLLEALKAVAALDECEAHFEDAFERLLPQIRAAISKAEPSQ